MSGVTVGSGPKPAEPVRVFLTPPGGREPLALYAESLTRAVDSDGTPDPIAVVVLAHDYPDLPDVTGWAVKMRGLAGEVGEVSGRTLTCEVTP